MARSVLPLRHPPLGLRPPDVRRAGLLLGRPSGHSARACEAED